MDRRRSFWALAALHVAGAAAAYTPSLDSANPCARQPDGAIGCVNEYNLVVCHDQTSYFYLNSNVTAFAQASPRANCYGTLGQAALVSSSSVCSTLSDQAVYCDGSALYQCAGGIRHLISQCSGVCCLDECVPSSDHAKCGGGHLPYSLSHKYDGPCADATTFPTTGCLTQDISFKCISPLDIVFLPTPKGAKCQGSAVGQSASALYLQAGKDICMDGHIVGASSGTVDYCEGGNHYTCGPSNVKTLVEACASGACCYGACASSWSDEGQCMAAEQNICHGVKDGTVGCINYYDFFECQHGEPVYYLQSDGDLTTMQSIWSASSNFVCAGAFPHGGAAPKNDPCKFLSDGETFCDGHAVYTCSEKTAFLSKSCANGQCCQGSCVESSSDALCGPPGLISAKKALGFVDLCDGKPDGYFSCVTEHVTVTCYNNVGYTVPAEAGAKCTGTMDYSYEVPTTDDICSNGFIAGITSEPVVYCSGYGGVATCTKTLETFVTCPSGICCGGQCVDSRMKNPSQCLSAVHSSFSSLGGVVTGHTCDDKPDNYVVCTTDTTFNICWEGAFAIAVDQSCQSGLECCESSQRCEYIGTCPVTTTTSILTTESATETPTQTTEESTSTDVSATSTATPSIVCGPYGCYGSCLDQIAGTLVCTSSITYNFCLEQAISPYQADAFCVETTICCQSLQRCTFPGVCPDNISLPTDDDSDNDLETKLYPIQTPISNLCVGIRDGDRVCSPDKRSSIVCASTVSTGILSAEICPYGSPCCDADGLCATQENDYKCPPVCEGQPDFSFVCASAKVGYTCMDGEPNENVNSWIECPTSMCCQRIGGCAPWDECLGVNLDVPEEL